jgi:hypothetical protein
VVLSAYERWAPIARADEQLAATTTEAIKANRAFDPNLVLSLIYLDPSLDDHRMRRLANRKMCQQPSSPPNPPACTGTLFGDFPKTQFLCSRPPPVLTAWRLAVVTTFPIE